MPVPSAGNLRKGGDVILFHCVLLASSALAIVLALAFSLEVRLRRALQRLLVRLFTFGERSMRKAPSSRVNVLIAMMIRHPFLLILSTCGCGPTADRQLAELADRSLAERANKANASLNKANRSLTPLACWSRQMFGFGGKSDCCARGAVNRHPREPGRPCKAA